MNKAIKTDPPLLEVRNLKMHFHTGKDAVVKAVDGVSFTIGRGQVLGLVGESGCGKTTVGKSILRIYHPTEGEVLYKGKDILKMSNSEFKSTADPCR